MQVCVGSQGTHVLGVGGMMGARVRQVYPELWAAFAGTTRASVCMTTAADEVVCGNLTQLRP